MEIIQKSIEELIPYINNPRKNDAAVDKVAGSIKEFGFKVPIVVDKDNVIVAGHTRYKAAQKLNIDYVPCVVADDLTDQQIKAFRIADNKVSEFSEWDEELLQLELEGLDDIFTGFDEWELDSMAKIEEQEQEIDQILHQQSIQIAPPQEYIIVLAKDAEEFEEMKSYFDLGQVCRGGYKRESPFNAVSLERVLTFERVKDANSNTE